MKTIRQWFETIADKEIREAAIRNAENDMPCTIDQTPVKDSLSWALTGGFVFLATPEGYGYWNVIYEQALNGTLKTINP